MIVDGQDSATDLELLIARLLADVPSGTELDAADRRAYDTALAISLGTALEHWPSVRRIVSRIAGPAGRSGALAMALATCGRATEVDDIHLRSCTTPGAIVVPVALASAALGASAEGARFAIVTGYEAVVSLAEMIGGAPILGKGIWPTRAVAPVAAALTAARAFGLGAEETREAAALAAGAHLTGALPQPGRELSLGLAVFAGVTSAIAAAEGVRGSRRLLEGWPTLATAGQPTTPLAEDGRRTSAVLDTCVKPFSSARQALAATVAVRALAESGAALGSRVRSVTIGIPEQHIAMVDRREVTSRLDMIVSLPYQIALAINSPESLDDVRRSVRLADDRSVQLMASVRITADPAAQAAYPSQWGASIRIDLDGEERCLRVKDVPGERSASWEALEEKGRRLFARAGMDEGEPATLRTLASGGARLAELAEVLARRSIADI